MKLMGRSLSKQFFAIGRTHSKHAAALVLVAMLVRTNSHAQMPGTSVPPASSLGNSIGMPPAVQASSQVRSSVTSQVTSTISLPGDTLGANDLIAIMVPYCPELSRNFRIGSDGMLRLPLLRQGILLAGKTPDQASTSIKEALEKEQVLAEPTVDISVVEFRSRTVSVTGAVIHPLTFQATGDITLLDAIAMAGGVSNEVGADILFTSTRHTPDGKIERSVRTIPVHSLLTQASPADNFLLHGGEEIRVSEAGKVFIAGNVVKPGMYVMQGNEETTVRKALALSQGLQSFSAHTAYIYRSTAGGTRSEIVVPLAKIIARKEPDITLVADDILYIPDNNGKRISARVLTGLAGFGQATATGLLIYK